MFSLNEDALVRMPYCPSRIEMCVFELMHFVRWAQHYRILILYTIEYTLTFYTTICSQEAARLYCRREAAAKMRMKQ